MKGSSVVNIFGRVPKKKTQNRPMVIKKSNGVIISIPTEAIKATGFLRESVVRRLLELNVSNMLWLNHNYGITFELGATAKKGIV